MEVRGALLNHVKVLLEEEQSEGREDESSGIKKRREKETFTPQITRDVPPLLVFALIIFDVGDRSTNPKSHQGSLSDPVWERDGPRRPRGTEPVDLLPS